ncbi:hypothetical protein ACFDWB_005071 [Salmonella enterica]|nr:hypothetical protein [Salmonella enterica subsp. enterica serovar Anecho]
MIFEIAAVKTANLIFVAFMDVPSFIRDISCSYAVRRIASTVHHLPVAERVNRAFSRIY